MLFIFPDDGWVWLALIRHLEELHFGSVDLSPSFVSMASITVSISSCMNQGYWGEEERRREGGREGEGEEKGKRKER